MLVDYFVEPSPRQLMISLKHLWGQVFTGLLRLFDFGLEYVSGLISDSRTWDWLLAKGEILLLFRSQIRVLFHSQIRVLFGFSHLAVFLWCDNWLCKRLKQARERWGGAVIFLHVCRLVLVFDADLLGDMSGRLRKCWEYGTSYHLSNLDWGFLEKVRKLQDRVEGRR